MEQGFFPPVLETRSRAGAVLAARELEVNPGVPNLRLGSSFSSRHSGQDGHAYCSHVHTHTYIRGECLTAMRGLHAKKTPNLPHTPKWGCLMLRWLWSQAGASTLPAQQLQQYLTTCQIRPSCWSKSQQQHWQPQGRSRGSFRSCPPLAAFPGSSPASAALLHQHRGGEPHDTNMVQTHISSL